MKRAIQYELWGGIMTLAQISGKGRARQDIKRETEHAVRVSNCKAKARDGLLEKRSR